jgi:peptidoglycan/LPS O-acetylase OafA/YrhL
VGVQTIAGSIARVAVPLFFIMSGFLFFRGAAFSAAIYRAKLRSRVKSLLIPFLFWNLALFALVAVGQHVPGLAPFFNGQAQPLTAMSPFQMVDAVIGITRYPTAYQFWFICDLMILVVLSPLLWLAARYARWAALAVFAVGWIFTVWPVSMPAIEPTLFFYLGGLAAIRGWSLFAVDRLGWWLLPVFALLLGLHCAEQLVYQTDRSLHPVMIVGLILALKVSRGLAESDRWRARLVALGGASFFVFAVHEPLVTSGKKRAFHTLPMTAGTVLLT